MFREHLCLFSRRFRIKVAGDFCIRRHGNITEKEQHGKYLKIKMWEVKASAVMGAL